MPAQASSQVDKTFIGASQQNLPAFMQDLDATLMTEAEMAEVRGGVVSWLGQRIPVFVAMQGIDAVAQYLGFNDIRFSWFAPLTAISQ